MFKEVYLDKNGNVIYQNQVDEEYYNYIEEMVSNKNRTNSFINDGLLLYHSDDLSLLVGKFDDNNFLIQIIFIYDEERMNDVFESIINKYKNSKNDIYVILAKYLGIVEILI